MEAMSPTVLLKALDGLSMRSAVTAHNIANANSPGYRPLKVSFEDALRRAAYGTPHDVAAVAPRLELALDEAGASAMRLDLELATASATAGRYGALIELLNRQLQIDALAVSGGH